MSITDPIGDMITRIRNAQLRSLQNVIIPCSKFRERILKDKKFLITGIGINIIKSPNIRNYPATNLQEVIKKSISNLEKDL